MPVIENMGASSGSREPGLASRPGPSGFDPARLKWNVPENLRWLADQDGRPAYMPCGMLTGAFLICVADDIERRAKCA